MKLGLDNAIVLVTGGTAGIGKAIVEGFLEEGAVVVYCSRGATGEEFPNQPAHGTQLDITNPIALNEWVSNAVREHGGIDVVLSNGM